MTDFNEVITGVLSSRPGKIEEGIEHTVSK